MAGCSQTNPAQSIVIERSDDLCARSRLLNPSRERAKVWRLWSSRETDLKPIPVTPGDNEGHRSMECGNVGVQVGKLRRVVMSAGTGTGAVSRRGLSSTRTCHAELARHRGSGSRCHGAWDEWDGAHCIHSHIMTSVLTLEHGGVTS